MKAVFPPCCCCSLLRDRTLCALSQGFLYSFQCDCHLNALQVFINQHPSCSNRFSFSGTWDELFKCKTFTFFACVTLVFSGKLLLLLSWKGAQRPELSHAAHSSLKLFIYPQFSEPFLIRGAAAPAAYLLMVVLLASLGLLFAANAVFLFLFSANFLSALMNQKYLEFNHSFKSFEIGKKGVKERVVWINIWNKLKLVLLEYSFEWVKFILTLNIS